MPSLEAFYTNLAPGTYRFHVIAANGDGVWNMAGATLRFRLPPSFLQSDAFIFACVATALVMAWTLYTMRTRQLSGRLRQRLEGQLFERERIARELHDTFLQNVQGLLLRFQAVLNRIPADQPIRDMMEQALERADEVLIEGRDRVRDLRAPPAADLTGVIAAFGGDLCAGETTRFNHFMEGLPRPLRPEAQAEILAIAQEAIRNAFVHASASKIELRLSYDRRAFLMNVIDDGVGIPAEWACKTGRPGHFGLTGMRERALRVGGSLLASSTHSGTTVALRVPAASAYQSRAARWLRSQSLSRNSPARPGGDDTQA